MELDDFQKSCLNLKFFLLLAKTVRDMRNQLRHSTNS